MNPVELIIKKRNRKKLSRLELEFFIKSYLTGKIPEYQMSSMLMAIFFSGMEAEEIQILTEIYINSGKRIKFPENLNTVDKHSTGGVGDKITIPLAPIVAACGVIVPMISGRGLGHTGGTLDKLESIPGFRTDFNESEFRNIIKKTGLSIISQSEELVPADKRIYALRDVSGTVESLPLITASIMSKKIAEGAQNLVIDLKVGTGAFIKTIEKAEELAELLIKTGEYLGQKVAVVFTDMNSPLGHYVGNALEIKESIEYLQGKRLPDIHLITKTLAVEMLIFAEKAKSREQAEQMVEEVLDNRKALDVLKKFIEAQKGNPAVCDDTSLLPQAKYKIPIISNKSGWVKEINSQQIGYALIDISAGRKTLESTLDYSSGAFLTKKIGDKIDKGEKIGIIYCNEENIGKIVAQKVMNNYFLIDEEIEKSAIILKIINRNIL